MRAFYSEINILATKISKTISREITLEKAEIVSVSKPAAMVFELKYHLGNVRASFSPNNVNMTTGTQTYNITSLTDYYPFGSQMPGRSFSSDSYRYGFQGQEKDDEVKGAGNSINYKYRMHDPRLGRFFAVDPLAPKYPHNSPYAFSENRIVDAVELEGLESKIVATHGTNVNVVLGIPFAESDYTQTIMWSDLYPGQKYGPEGPGSRHIYVNTDDYSVVADEFYPGMEININTDNYGFQFNGPMIGAAEEYDGILLDEPPMDGAPFGGIVGQRSANLILDMLNTISEVTGFVSLTQEIMENFDFNLNFIDKPLTEINYGDTFSFVNNKGKLNEHLGAGVRDSTAEDGYEAIFGLTQDEIGEFDTVDFSKK